MAGKGDKPRPVNRERFEANWERIFGGDGKSSSCNGGSTPPASTISYGDTDNQQNTEGTCDNGTGTGRYDQVAEPVLLHKPPGRLQGGEAGHQQKVEA